MEKSLTEKGSPVDPMAEEAAAVRRLNIAGQRNKDRTTQGAAAAKAVKAGFDITNETTSRILGFGPIKQKPPK